MTRKLRPLAALALIALVGVISAGCGSSTSSETSSAKSTRSTGTASSATSTKKKLTARDKAVKFSECIRAHGVRDFPDPDAHNQYQYGVSVTPTVWTKAVNACKDLQPPGTLSGKRTPKQQSASLRFAQCVREHGVKDFPDPVNGEPLINTYKIPSSNKPGGMAILNAATQKCGSVLGDVVGDRGGGTGSGG
jgi:hypothetical protein